MRRRVTRRLARLQTMCNVLKYCKILKKLRCGRGAVEFIFSIYLNPVMYMMFHFSSIGKTGVIFFTSKAKVGNNSKNIDARVMNLVNDSCPP